MSREFRFSSHRLLELVASAKCPAKESEHKWKDRGSRGKELRLALDLVDGPFAGFVLYVFVGGVRDVTTYRAALILEGGGTSAWSGLQFHSTQTILQKLHRKRLAREPHRSQSANC